MKNFVFKHFENLAEKCKITVFVVRRNQSNGNWHRWEQAIKKLKISSTTFSFSYLEHFQSTESGEPLQSCAVESEMRAILSATVVCSRMSHRNLMK